MHPGDDSPPPLDASGCLHATERRLYPTDTREEMEPMRPSVFLHVSVLILWYSILFMYRKLNESRQRFFWVFFSIVPIKCSNKSTLREKGFPLAQFETIVHHDQEATAAGT